MGFALSCLAQYFPYSVFSRKHIPRGGMLLPQNKLHTVSLNASLATLPSLPETYNCAAAFLRRNPSRRCRMRR